MAAYYAETVNVSGSEGRPVRYLGAYASANLFDILRVRPVLGRTFRPGGGPSVNPAGDDPELPGLAGSVPRRPPRRRRVGAGQQRNDDDRRRDAGEVRLPGADGRVAATAHRSAGVPARLRSGARVHAAPGHRAAQGRRLARDRAGRDVAHRGRGSRPTTPSRTRASA